MLPNSYLNNLPDSMSFAPIRALACWWRIATCKNTETNDKDDPKPSTKAGFTRESLKSICPTMDDDLIDIIFEDIKSHEEKNGDSLNTLLKRIEEKEVNKATPTSSQP